MHWNPLPPLAKSLSETTLNGTGVQLNDLEKYQFFPSDYFDYCQQKLFKIAQYLAEKSSLLLHPPALLFLLFRVFLLDSDSLRLSFSCHAGTYATCQGREIPVIVKFQ